MKSTKLAEEHNFSIHDAEGFDPCESDRNSCPNNTPLFAFQPITTGDVHKIIKSLPSNKAPCCDKVNAKILKDSSPVIAPIITSLINNSFTLSTFPLPWKKADLSYKFLRLQQIILLFDGMEQDYLHGRFQYRAKTNQRDTRQNNDLTLPRYRLATGQKTFTYRRAKLYNSIAKDIRETGNLNVFNKKIFKYLLNS